MHFKESPTIYCGEDVKRNKCKNYDMKSLTNNEKTSKEICDYVYVEGNKLIQKFKIPVTLIAVNMGGVNPPDEVKAERSRTAASKQRELTIIQETKNELERKNSERERANADKAYQNALGLSTTEFIKLRELKVKEIGYSKANTITIIEGQVGVTKNVQ
jgi:hypothetical protein